MTFFYDLNARLNSIAAKPVQRQLNEGAKPDFLDLDRDGNKTEPMKKAAGSARKSDMDESALQAYLGKKKYGEQGMKALQKAGRDGVSKQKMDAIRNKHDKMDEGEVAPEHNRAKKVDVPAFQRKAKGGDWKTTQKDLDKDRERNISDRKGLARLRGADPDTVDEGWDDMIKDVDRRRGQMKPGEKIQGHKGEIERTTTGIRHTRRYDDKTGETDVGDGEGQPQKKGRGRPKGTGKSIGAKGPSGKSKLMTKEGDVSTGNLQKMHQLVSGLKMFVQDEEGLALLKELTGLVKHYMNQGSEKPLDEKAVSKSQQKFMGMVHATQKGEKAPSKEVAKVAKSMPKKEAEKFASTKHKGLPEKVGKKKTEESTDEAPKATGSKGGMQFGKGIYDSFNRELEQMIAESMNVSMNMSTDPQGGPTKSLTVTATDEDAVYLGKLLKMAGMGGESGCGCGTSPCSCDQMEEAYGNTEATENAPDYPTNTEINDDVMQYAGGINKPKSTGQTTVPVIASQTDRQVTDEDDAMGRTGDDITLGEEDALRRMMEMAGMSQNDRLDEGMMDKIKGMLVPKLMKLLGPDADNIANAVRQATGGDLTPSKENAMKVVQALGIDKAATQGQSQMAEGIAGNWQGKLIQSLYTLGLLGSAAVTNWAYGPGRGTDLGVASGIITMIGVVLLMFAATFFSSNRGMVGAMGRHGNKGFDTNKGPNSLGEDDLDRMMEMAGVKKKEVDEEKTEEGNKFTGNLAKARAAGKKEADLDGDGDLEKVKESIFDLTNQWRAYKG